MIFHWRHLLVPTLLIKLVIALVIPLSLDEYYYFLWGQLPSLSYFDHPPMVGWLMILSQPLKIIGEGAIRWPFLLMSHLTLWLWLDLFQRANLSYRQNLFFWVALLNPLWGWGVFIATPDIPLLFFWTLAIYCLDRVLREEGTNWSYALGICLGLGFLAKYQMVLFLPALLLALVLKGKLSLFLRPRTWLAVILGLIACSPVLIWNQQNNWASFAFQWEHGMASKYWNWKVPFDYVIGQFFIIFPPFVIPWFTSRRWTSQWLWPFAIFPFIFFLYSSFKGKVEANWVIMSLPIFYLIGVSLASETLEKWQSRSVQLWGVLFLAVVGICFLPPHFSSEKIKLFESRQFAPLLHRIDSSQHYYAYNYQMAAYLSFKTEKLVCKFPLYGRQDHFNYMQDCQTLPEQFIYITKDWEQPPLDKDFPEYVILNESPISPGYKAIEMRKN